MRGQIVELETRPPAVRGVVTGQGGYVVGRADGRVLCGSTMELAGFDKKVTAGGLRRVLDTALALVPGLGDAPVRETWANFRPFTDDKLPVLGETPVRGLFLATGHFRNGILLSAVTAEVMRDVVLGRPPGIELGPFSAARLY
jgi:glycine oxidase